jgi:hypothetical protein
LAWSPELLGFRYKTVRHCDFESESSGAGHAPVAIFPLGCYTARVVVTGTAIIVWVQVRPDRVERSPEAFPVEEAKRSN